MVDITNIITVSTATSPRGLGNYNVNNLLVLTDESPVEVWTDKYRVYNTYSDVVSDWGSSSKAAKMALSVFSQSPNILTGGGQLIIAPYEEDETLSEAITRLYSDVYFGGVITTDDVSSADAIAASNVVQALDTILFLTSKLTTDVEEDGLFKTLFDKGNTKTKGILYTIGTDNKICGAYASRGMSVNFSAQNTTNTMNLKDLAGISPDTGITQTVLNNCESVGVDCYTYIGGIPKVFSFSNGLFFDEVFNRLWFTQSLKVAYFNSLATTSSKIPQTEAGMNSIKNKIKTVCELALYNGFFAPGTWNGSDKFGDPETFDRNISEVGYFIYSRPITEQSQEDRVARIAPVLQIAGKEAGAIHSGNIIVNFEA